MKAVSYDDKQKIEYLFNMPQMGISYYQMQKMTKCRVEKNFFLGQP